MSQQIYHFSNGAKQKRSFRRVYAIAAIFVIVVFSFITFMQFLSTDSSQVDRMSSGIVAPYIDELNFDLEKPIVSPIWPKEIQSATGALGYGVLAQSEESPKALPMASLAKVMAAILIIEKDNVTLDDPGEDIIYNLYDEELYNKYLYEGGVVTTVKAGESISQKDAITAMLMSSSNNLADTATIWTFGSIEEYLEAANAKAKELGMNNTNFADVTGFSKDSKSTASDLILLAEYAMTNNLFSSIVGTWQTTINEDIELTSTNLFLDFEGNGVIGVKSGLTDEAGGTYISAALRTTPEGESYIAIAVTLGAKTHFAAQEAAMPLIDAVSKGFNAQ